MMAVFFFVAPRSLVLCLSPVLVVMKTLLHLTFLKIYNAGVDRWR